MTICKICNDFVDEDDAEFYPGFGNLCEDCDERADIVRNVRGNVIRATVAPRQGGR